MTETFRTELMRGSLDLMILSVLAEGEKYGYLIQQSLRDSSHGKADPKGPSGLKKMFAKLFRSGGKDVDGNAASPKDAKKGVSSVYDTM